MLKHQLIYFLKVTNFGITFDTGETFPNSPRIIGLFTISYLAYSQFIGKTNIDRTQYTFLKIVPFAIVLIHSSILIFKRRFLITCDDIFCFIIFFTSLALYFTYESPYSLTSGRSAQPFL
jgi:hypothetical protein